MQIKLNNLYRFTWEDHYKGDWNGYARQFNHIKEFSSQIEAEDYYQSMISGNICKGILDYGDGYDAALETGDSDIIEDYILKNTFVL